MDDEQQLTQLLTRAADSAGHFAPPPVDELVSRRKHRIAAQPLLAVAASVVVVAGLAAGLSLVGNGGGGGQGKPQAAAAGQLGTAQLAKYQWRSLPAAPISTTKFEVTQWTGKQVLVVGRNGESAAYDPAKRQWHRLPAGAPALSDLNVSAWDGHSLYVWSEPMSKRNDMPGRRYDVKTNSWHRMAGLPYAESYIASVAVVHGHLLAFGVDNAEAKQLNVAEYDPKTGWSQKPALKTPDPQVEDLHATAVASKAVVLLSMGHDNPKENAIDYAPPQAYAYSPSNGAWRRLPTEKSSDFSQQVLPLGNQVMLTDVHSLVAGNPPHSATISDLLDPTTGRLTRLPLAQEYTGTDTGNGKSVPAIYSAQYVWTGRTLLALEGGGPHFLQAWQPGDASWRALPGSTGKTPPTGDAVWAGDRLLVLPRVAAGARGWEFAPR